MRYLLAINDFVCHLVFMSSTEIITPTELVALLERQDHGVEYQPIIQVDSQEIFAYEALSRFFDQQNQALRPDLVYAALHQSPLSLFQVEYQQKKLQLDHAPSKLPIFVNLDQDSYFSSGVQGQDNPFLQLFRKYPNVDIVVELIENSEINDAVMSLAMIDSLSTTGIKTAIDDVFNPMCMISTSVIQLVNFIKLDKHVIANKNQPDFLVLVNCFIDYAHQAGKKVILEGVETHQDLLFAKQINVDFVQGFLYRDKFINIR
jgi:EAL domain-containing protein (putative c-di-GMP-specific phosphodiesterase class I)